VIREVRHQGARAWQLRAAISLPSRHLLSRPAWGGASLAQGHLRAILGGFRTRDLIVARQAHKNCAMQTQVVEQPRELDELTARIERLRERLKQGDPDMIADKIQAAIDRATEKRRELQDQHQTVMPSARMFTMLPRAAEAYRRQITLGLGGDPRAALKARSILRELFGGKIRLVPQLDGGLIAHWNLHPGALLNVPFRARFEATKTDVVCFSGDTVRRGDTFDVHAVHPNVVAASDRSLSQKTAVLHVVLSSPGITTWPKRYTCREYGVGCMHIAFQLEIAALIFAMLTAIALVIRGIIFTGLREIVWVTFGQFLIKAVVPITELVESICSNRIDNVSAWISRSMIHVGVGPRVLG
jgi:uncharacterized coiled-coil protein SlyX